MTALKLGFWYGSGWSRAPTHGAVVQRELETHAKGTARLALDRDARGVAAESVSVGPDPLDAGAEVEQAEVAGALLRLLGRREEAEQAEAVLERD